MPFPFNLCFYLYLYFYFFTSAHGSYFFSIFWVKATEVRTDNTRLTLFQFRVQFSGEFIPFGHPFSHTFLTRFVRSVVKSGYTRPESFLHITLRLPPYLILVLKKCTFAKPEFMNLLI